MSSKDKYYSFEKLTSREREGIDFKRYATSKNSQIAIIAPHGGGIESGTSEIAKALARNDFSLYYFEGLKARGNKALHIKSNNFDEPRCVGLVKHSQKVVAIHGCRGRSRTVYVGGLDEYSKTRVIQTLRSAGIKAIRDNSRHSGRDIRNICNRGISGKGVQLEITEGLRRKMFKGFKKDERKIRLPFFDRFIRSVKDVLHEANKKNIK